jgi:S-adenosylmethionine synthetase
VPAISVEELRQLPVEQQPIEIVERKGTGHPDSICDAVMEQAAVALCQEYIANFGRILHFNLDKGLLVAGCTQPRLGGGRVLEPMRLVYGDRATTHFQGKCLDVAAVVEASARGWMRSHLRWVDPVAHVVFQNELKGGSPELTDLFERKAIGTNDTSAAVGYAPLSETEQLVLGVEHYLNSPEFKLAFPETGEDVKVMGYRRNRELTLTIALALVDREVPSACVYFERKQAMRAALEDYLTYKLHRLDRVTIALNTLDDPRRSEAGAYLTVLGTSAEGAVGGQVGRGNRVNGVIALNRPMGTEAAAGKNPVSHVGKIYTLLTHHIAARIYADLPCLREVYVWLGSQIGRPIDQPLIASAQLSLQPGVALEDVAPAARSIIDGELNNIESFTRQLTRGLLPVC